MTNFTFTSIFALLICKFHLNPYNMSHFIDDPTRMRILQQCEKRLVPLNIFRPLCDVRNIHDLKDLYFKNFNTLYFKYGIPWEDGEFYNDYLFLTFYHGKLKGVYEEYFETGDIKIKCAYDKKGERHGKYESFREDGSVERYCEYFHGRLHGEYYLSDDAMTQRAKEITSYKNGSRHGKSYLFRNGALIEENNYINNLKYGDCIQYTSSTDDNKIFKIVKPYYADRIHGEVLYYNDRNKVVKREKYIHDKKVKRKRFFNLF